MSLYIGTTPIRKVFVADGSGVNIESNKTVSPSTSQVVVQPDTNYDALAQVTVNPINIQPLSITSNGTYTASGGVDGYSPITVNVSGGGGGGSYPWFGPNTVKDYTKTITINLKDDTSFDSWTASTSATSILASPTTNDFTYSYDRDTDAVTIVCTVITNFTLKSTATKQLIPISTGRTDWHCFSGTPSTYTQFQSLTVGTQAYKTVSDVRLYYYGTNGTKYPNTVSYGVYPYGAPSYAQSASGSTVTISGKRSAIYARCSASYFDTARKNDIDSENTDVVITFDVYKTPRENTFIVHGLNDMLTAMNAAPDA